MRITIIANGSRGDVQPFVALGAGLLAAGYSVHVAAPTPFRAFVEARGLIFEDLEFDPRQMLADELGHAWLETGHNPFGFIGRLKPLVEPLLEQFLAATLRACEGSDAIVYSPLGIFGWHYAESAGIPAILASPVPAIRTAHIPNPIVPPLPLPRLTNSLGYRIPEQLAWQMFRGATNRWRVETLGLPPLPLSGPYRQIEREREIVLLGYSPSVIPKPPDWGEHIHVTGYWFLDRPVDWQPPATLDAFLAAGPPPVYIGLGSMTGRDPEALTQLALGALRRTHQRGVLLAGWAGLGGLDLPEDVCLVDDIPHDWLFPRMAAVAHHGGAGTTGAGLRAGKPSILLPYFADQPFWGRVVHDLGAGPPPIPQKQLTTERLAAAINRAVTSPGILRRARTLGERIRAEDGVGNAVAVLSRRLSG
jgi:UDP:flavonoid glycosyltransferase YjiC (YdhE family)